MPLDATTYLPPAAVSEEAAIVRRMMELLKEPESWCQGTRYRDGAMCLLGAAEKACTVGQRLEVKAVNKAIHRECDLSIHAWNDAPGRTHAEILAMLARVLRGFEGV